MSYCLANYNIQENQCWLDVQQKMLNNISTSTDIIEHMVTSQHGGEKGFIIVTENA